MEIINDSESKPVHCPEALPAATHTALHLHCSQQALQKLVEKQETRTPGD